MTSAARRPVPPLPECEDPFYDVQPEMHQSTRNEGYDHEPEDYDDFHPGGLEVYDEFPEVCPPPPKAPTKAPPKKATTPPAFPPPLKKNIPPIIQPGSPESTEIYDDFNEPQHPGLPFSPKAPPVSLSTMPKKATRPPMRQERSSSPEIQEDYCDPEFNTGGIYDSVNENQLTAVLPNKPLPKAPGHFSSSPDELYEEEVESGSSGGSFAPPPPPPPISALPQGRKQSVPDKSERSKPVPLPQKKISSPSGGGIDTNEILQGLKKLKAAPAVSPKPQKDSLESSFISVLKPVTANVPDTKFKPSTRISPTKPSATVRPSTLPVKEPLPQPEFEEEIYDEATSARPQSPVDSILGPLQPISYQWYHGSSLERKEASCRLNSYGGSGTFIVRKSQTGGPDKPYSIHILYSGTMKVIQIRVRKDGKVCLGRDGDDKAEELAFSCIADLVKHHEKSDIVLLGDRISYTKLTGYPKRDTYQ